MSEKIMKLFENNTKTQNFLVLFVVLLISIIISGFSLSVIDQCPNENIDENRKALPGFTIGFSAVSLVVLLSTVGSLMGKTNNTQYNTWCTNVNTPIYICAALAAILAVVVQFTGIEDVNTCIEGTIVTEDYIQNVENMNRTYGIVILTVIVAVLFALSKIKTLIVG